MENIKHTIKEFSGSNRVLLPVISPKPCLLQFLALYISKDSLIEISRCSLVKYLKYSA